MVDAKGDEFTVKVWHTHDVSRWWCEGWDYVLKQGRGTHRQDGGVVLHTTTDFAADRPPSVVDLFAVGDSHIGRESRPADGNSPYHTARQFVAAMGYAARYGVDAVIHAGDLFDDDPRLEDLAIAESGFDILREHGIPYYYVHGNHGVDTAESFYSCLEGMEATHLATAGDRLGDVDLFGLDYGAADGIERLADSFAPSADGRHRHLAPMGFLSKPSRPPRPDSTASCVATSTLPNSALRSGRTYSVSARQPESVRPKMRRTNRGGSFVSHPTTCCAPV